MINTFRKLLIRIGKVLPFVVCLLTCIHYAENAFALATNDFLVYDGVVIPNAQFSFLIGLYFEYNVQTLIVLCVLSISIRTCIHNKLACAYLGVNLLEKWYFDFELETTTIYIICIINIAITSFLCYKGIRILLSSRKQ